MKMSSMILMMVKDNKEIRHLLLKLGVALAISAGLLYSRLRKRRAPTHLNRPNTLQSPFSGESKIDLCRKMGLESENRAIQQTSSVNAAFVEFKDYEETSDQKVTTDRVLRFSPRSKSSNDYVFPEFNEFLLEESNGGISPRKDFETPITFERAAEKESENEIISLKNMLQVLREREKNVEIQLLEYYGAKEKETAVMEIHNQLKLNSVEAKVFTLKIESLLADKGRLEEQVADHSRVVAELESAKAKVNLLKWKIKSDAEQNKEEISAQRLNDFDIKELKKANSRLQWENGELLRRLESTQIIGNSTLDDTSETEALHETIRRLRNENGDLVKEIDQLQAKCCDDAKEQVYLKWVNACLRYELRNYQVPRGKTMARDLSKNLSPRSEEKAKQLVLEYANSEVMDDESLNSMDFKSESFETSNLKEVGNVDDSSTGTSSAMKKKKSRRAKFFRKVKKLVLHKRNDHSNQISSVGSTTTSNNASRRREMASSDPFRTMSRRYSCSPLFSPCNSNISITSLDRFEARTNDKMKKITSPSKSTSRTDIQRLKIPKPRLPSRLLGHGRRS
ncbi:hypothetical protein BVC80_209g236 [Macleaya cordata]|uniref:Actin binding protein family n=1 Tax=Macleaya cordata TaxID=56857 RepID=A0A200QDF1_MACCD|nr:hypothetical protein BVC80_209g236 [Macleaya cordata]